MAMPYEKFKQRVFGYRLLRCITNDGKEGGFRAFVFPTPSPFITNHYFHFFWRSEENAATFFLKN
jgi:hypothetical protein